MTIRVYQLFLVVDSLVLILHRLVDASKDIDGYLHVDVFLLSVFKSECFHGRFYLFVRDLMEV